MSTCEQQALEEVREMGTDLLIDKMSSLVKGLKDGNGAKWSSISIKWKWLSDESNIDKDNGNPDKDKNSPDKAGDKVRSCSPFEIECKVQYQESQTVLRWLRDLLPYITIAIIAIACICVLTPSKSASCSNVPKDGQLTAPQNIEATASVRVGQGCSKESK